MGCGQGKQRERRPSLTEVLNQPPPAQDEIVRKKVSLRNQEYQDTVELIFKVPLFKRLPKHRHPIVAEACTLKTFYDGDYIINQGDTSTELWILRSGQAQVLISNDGGEAEEVNILDVGDYFGEAALLRNEPRNATIRAITHVTALSITQEKFRELKLDEDIQFATGHRKAVGEGRDTRGAEKIQVQPPTKKSREVQEFIVGALRCNATLQALTSASLDEARLKQLADACWREDVPAGKDLIMEGDEVAHYFYIVKSGSFKINVSEAAAAEEVDDNVPVTPNSTRSPTRADKKRKVGFVQSGGSFGELALLYSAPRAATVSAVEDSEVWVIDRGTFKTTLMSVAKERVNEYVKYLDSVKILRKLNHEEKLAVAEAMIEMHFSKGDVILTQGKPGNTFYVLFDGEVQVVVDGKSQGTLVASSERRTARFFGERALLENAPRAATVEVISDKASAMVLDKASFETLLGPLEDTFKRRSAWERCGACVCGASAPSGGQRRMRKTKSQQVRSVTARLSKGEKIPLNGADGDGHPSHGHGVICKEDLRQVGFLGSGAFGTVDLWEHNATRKTFALKSLYKGHLVRMKMTKSVVAEKLILMMTHSPFIVQLYETYSDAHCVSFLLEAALGGELYTTYLRELLHGSVEHARFYCASVALAFEHMHDRRIIYRDLKPENLMLDHHGFLKVTDFGLSKFVIGMSYTTCGTPDYFAPELITSAGHTTSLDWWTLGILMFELMTGSTPFESDHPSQTYTRILKGIDKVRFPSAVQGACADLVKALCRAHPAERLPMRPGGVPNVKNHKWYQSFNWEALRTLSMTPPFKPKCKSSRDLENFKQDRPEKVTPMEYVDDGSGWDDGFATA